MRKLVAKLLCGAVLMAPVHGQTGPVPETETYYLVFLRRAPDRKPLAEGEGERIQAAHMANILAMADRGVLVAAGPFDDTPPAISGIFVMKAGSLDEARGIAARDPTVAEHRNNVEVVAWRGPKGIGAEYFRLHKQDPKTPEGMGVQPFFLLYRGSVWERGRAQVSGAHEAYVEGLRRGGKLAAAGPVPGEGDPLAILIFNRMSDEEARRLVEDDPAVKAGVFRAEQHRWWCAAHVLPE